MEQRSLADAASELPVGLEDRPARDVLGEPSCGPVDLWTGLVRLAWVALPAVRGLEPDRSRVSDRAWRIPEDVASAIVGAARAGDAALLRDLLRPDPQRNETTWTVACFQIGDLAPSAIRDFADPVAAVLQFAGCGEPMHVAAELVASDSGGSRWTALVRTGDRLVFQLFGDASAESASSTGSSVVEAVRLRWAERLAASARRQAVHGSAVHGSAVHGSAVHGSAVHGGVDLAGSGWWRTGTIGPAGALRTTPGPDLPRDAGDLRSELEALGRLADAAARRLGGLAGPRNVRRGRGPRGASERPAPNAASSGPMPAVTSARLAPPETPSVSDVPSVKDRAGPGASGARIPVGCTDGDRSSMAR